MAASSPPPPPPPPSRRGPAEPVRPEVIAAAASSKARRPTIRTAKAGQRWKNRDGLTPDVHYRGTIRGFSIALILLALFQVIPAILAIIHNWQLEEPELIQRWVYLLILASILQIAYGVYLWQLPDWSSLWVVALVSLSVATLYAALLAIRVLADENHSFLAFLQLNMADISPAKQSGWCLIIVILFGTYCYFVGRAGLKWFQRFREI